MLQVTACLSPQTSRSEIELGSHAKSCFAARMCCAASAPRSCSRNGLPWFCMILWAWLVALQQAQPLLQHFDPHSIILCIAWPVCLGAGASMHWPGCMRIFGVCPGLWGACCVTDLGSRRAHNANALPCCCHMLGVPPCALLMHERGKQSWRLIGRLWLL